MKRFQSANSLALGQVERSVISLNAAPKSVRPTAECVEGIEAPVRGVLPKPAADALFQSCSASANRQLFDIAAQKLARGQRLDMAVDLAQMAVARDPAAVNSRLTLVIALHIAGRYADEIEHLNYLIIAAPEETCGCPICDPGR